jgi:hypothetical protein
MVDGLCGIIKRLFTSIMAWKMIVAFFFVETPDSAVKWVFKVHPREMSIRARSRARDIGGVFPEKTGSGGAAA